MATIVLVANCNHYIEWFNYIQKFYKNLTLLRLFVFCNSGQDLKDIMKHIEDLLVYENYSEEEKDHSRFV